MDAKKRLEVRAELVAQGYSFDYVDSWPPKVTLYPHKDLLSVDGKVAIARGTPLPNHPGHPDHLARKSRIGLLSWPPSDVCRCRACRELREVAQPEPVEATEVATEHVKTGTGACSCGWKSTAPKSTSRESALYKHIHSFAAVAA